MPGLFSEGAFSRRPRGARRQPVDRLQGHGYARRTVCDDRLGVADGVVKKNIASMITP
jgi:hypothetical protein